MLTQVEEKPDNGHCKSFIYMKCEILKIAIDTNSLMLQIVNVMSLLINQWHVHIKGFIVIIGEV